MHYFELMWFTFSVNVHPLGFYWILSLLRLTVPSEKCWSFGSLATGLFMGRGAELQQHLLRLASTPNLGRAYAAPFVAILSCALTRAFWCPQGNPVQGAGSAPSRSAQCSNTRLPWRTLTAQTLARPAVGIKGKAGPRRGRTALRNCML